ncbi:MAG: CorA family divalent cation transporter, partial [Gemmatimonadaceae bacterium]
MTPSDSPSTPVPTSPRTASASDADVSANASSSDRSGATVADAAVRSSGDAKLPRCVFVSPQGAVTRDLKIKEIATHVSESKGVLWVDIDSTSRQQLALLEKVFKFHPLAIEDVLNPVSRPKVEQYDDYLFVTLRVVRFCDDTTDPY